MNLRTPIPRPESVTVYTFELAWKPQALVIDVWKKRGDKVRQLKNGDFVFTFPRIKFTQVVEKHNRLTYAIEEQERLYVDAKELQQRMIKEIKEQEQKRQERVSDAHERRLAARTLVPSPSFDDVV